MAVVLAVTLCFLAVIGFLLFRKLEIQPEQQLPQSSQPSNKHFESREFGISFDYPSDMNLGNIDQSSSTLYLAFCVPVSCGMEPTEFLIVKKTDSDSIEAIDFDYSHEWKTLYGFRPVTSSSSTELARGENIWLAKKVAYYDQRVSNLWLMWYQTLANHTLASFSLPPDESYTNLILTSFKFTK